LKVLRCLRIDWNLRQRGRLPNWGTPSYHVWWLLVIMR
jgi:hypothetical protein